MNFWLVGLEIRRLHIQSTVICGQRQRVDKSVTTNPKVLLCDEATSALSIQKTIVQILDLIRDVNKNLGLQWL